MIEPRILPDHTGEQNCTCQHCRGVHFPTEQEIRDRAMLERLKREIDGGDSCGDTPYIPGIRSMTFPRTGWSVAGNGSYRRAHRSRANG